MIIARVHVIVDAVADDHDDVLVLKRMFAGAVARVCVVDPIPKPCGKIVRTTGRHYYDKCRSRSPTAKPENNGKKRD